MPGLGVAASGAGLGCPPAARRAQPEPSRHRQPTCSVCQLIRLLRPGESRRARSRVPASQPAPAPAQYLPVRHPAASTAGARRVLVSGTGRAEGVQQRWSGRAGRSCEMPPSWACPGPCQAASRVGSHWGGSLDVLPAPGSWVWGDADRAPAGWGVWRSLSLHGPPLPGQQRGRSRQEAGGGSGGAIAGSCSQPHMGVVAHAWHSAGAHSSLQSSWPRGQGVKSAWQKL